MARPILGLEEITLCKHQIKNNIMKGKDTFTAAEIADLRELIRLRVKAHTKSEQKKD